MGGEGNLGFGRVNAAFGPIQQFRNVQDGLSQPLADTAAQVSVFTREMLLNRVWGYDYYGGSRTVDVHIRRIRAKIEPDPAHPTSIRTVRGAGYMFVPPED